MNRQAFGDLVRSMRCQRLYTDETNDFRQWSRAYLARISGLSERQIRRVETGEVINLYPLLENLADAFGITDLERIEFYAQAGYTYAPEPTIPNLSQLEQLLRQIDYPAYIRTPLWDFLAFNQFSAKLWGYDNPATLALFAENPLRANMLRTIFDPRFEHKAYKGGEANWYQDAQRSILGFRTNSFQHGHTERYHELLKGLKALPEFERHWLLSERMPNDIFAPSSPTLAVFHPLYGKMEFMSTRIPARYIGGDIEATIYVPLSASQNRYQQLQQDVTNNVIHRFT